MTPRKAELLNRLLADVTRWGGPDCPQARDLRELAALCRVAPTLPAAAPAVVDPLQAARDARAGSGGTA